MIRSRSGSCNDHDRRPLTLQPATATRSGAGKAMHNATLLLVILGGLAAATPVPTPWTATAAAAAGSVAGSFARDAVPGAVPGAPGSRVPGCAPADTLIHRVQPGDTLNRLAVRYRAQAGWYGQADCLAAIREANGLQDSNLLRVGQALRIPCHQAPPPPRAAAAVKDGAPLHGLYLPAPICGFEAVFARVDSFTAAGGNAVVFDAKDIDGGVSFRSAHPLAVWGKGRSAPVIADLADLVRRLHQRDLYVVGRLALFLDGELGRQRPDLALQDSTGAPWTERDCAWLDPTAPAVRDYLTTLALELVGAGVDEVQIDYVRFPTNGWRGDWQGDPDRTAARRRAVITDFVAALHDTLAGAGVVLSADLFGIMAWGRTADLALTGQHVPSLAPYLDVICPMIYPSHFGPGFDGLDNPGDHPETMIAEGVRRFREQAGPGTPVRPWLQAFSWRVRDYDAGYVRAQIDAAAAAGAAGWCLWNPAGRYEVAVAGLQAAPLPLPSPWPQPASAATLVAARAGPRSQLATRPATSGAPGRVPQRAATAPGDVPAGGHRPAWGTVPTAPASAPASHQAAPLPAGPCPQHP